MPRRSRVRHRAVSLPTLVTLEDRNAPALLTWSGAINGLWSNADNWTSTPDTLVPANGDELLFSAGNNRGTIDADIPNLNLKSITFDNKGDFLIGGSKTISLGTITDSSTSGTNKIALPLNLDAATLSVTVANSTSALNFFGIISGTNGIEKYGDGLLELSGPNPNSYLGLTYCLQGELRLNKVPLTPGPSIAVPGDLLIDGTVTLLQNDQIAKTASVRVNTNARVTFDGFSNEFSKLTLNGGTVIGGVTMTSGAPITVFANNNNSVLLGNLAFTAPGSTITVDDGAAFDDLLIGSKITGSSGFVKDGPGVLHLSSLDANSLTGTTKIVAGTLFVDLLQQDSPIDLAGGILSTRRGEGYVGVITASGGDIDLSQASTGVPTVLIANGLGGTSGKYVARVGLDAKSVVNADLLTVNGPVDLTGFTLAVVSIDKTPTVTTQSLTLIANDGTDKVTGNFAGLPQGAAVTANGQTFTITYTGGDGNDVALVPATLAIADVKALESAGKLEFTVTLNAALPSDVKVDFATADGTAKAEDYTTATGTLTIPAGKTSGIITVAVANETNFENDETFTITLSNPVGATIVTGKATGTIQNDDAAPTLSINNSSVAEGNSGTATMTFTVTLSAPDETQVNVVTFATADGNATAGKDYTAANSTLTIPAGKTSGIITVAVANETNFENDETFTITLSNPVGATIVTGKATGTIQNDDAAPTLSINNSSVAEGNSGTATMTFTVTLSAPDETQVNVVTFVTADGNATAGKDYTAANSTLAFSTGETQKTIAITVVGDTALEFDETFTVTISSLMRTVTNKTGTGTIRDDELPGTLNVDSPSIVEGSSNNTLLTFTLTLESPVGVPASVDFFTSNGTATDRFDFFGQNGTLTFAPGETVKTIQLTVFADLDIEPNETVFLNFDTKSVNALRLFATKATGTIIDDDTPTITIGNVALAEGNSGTTTFNFPVSFSGPTANDVTILFNVQRTGTATQPDLDIQQGVLTITGGQASGTIAINVKGDTDIEPNETFFVELSLGLGSVAIFGTSKATGTILNDDAPVVSIADFAAFEGNSGTTAFSFPVSLDVPFTSDITVAFAVELTGTADATDLAVQTGTVTIPAGQTTGVVTINVNGDAALSADETFAVVLSNPTGATLGKAMAIGTIRNDDAVTLAIANAQIVEGNSGTAEMVFTVTLTGTSEVPGAVTVNFATADGTATAGSDYTATTGTLTFAPGVTAQTVTVNVNGDTDIEPDEAFTVTLSAPTGATLATGTATGTITNDDIPPPTLSINDVSVVEGNSGTTSMTFTVTLSAPSTTAVTVAFATADRLAVQPFDYTAANGTLTFAPGVTAQTIRINVSPDQVVEPVEVFIVNLSNPVGATLADGSGTGVIVNDDDDTPPQDIIPPTINPIPPQFVTVGQEILVPFRVNFGNKLSVFSLQATSDNQALISESNIGFKQANFLNLLGVNSDLDGQIRIKTTAGTAGGVVRITLFNPDFLVTETPVTQQFFVNITPPPLSLPPQFVVGADLGGSQITFFGPNREKLSNSSPFGSQLQNGVRVASADFNGDGIPDLVVGTGPGRPTEALLLDGKTGGVVTRLNTFEPSFTGGIFVAAGDLNGDGAPEIIITPDQGGGPRVRIFSPDVNLTFNVAHDFFGIDDKNFRGGARTAIGDLNGDGVGDLVVAAGFGGGPRVAGFEGKSVIDRAPRKLFGDFFAFEQDLRNGIFVAVGDIDGDGFGDMICGGGPDGGPRVLTFSGKALTAATGQTSVQLSNFFAGPSTNRGGIHVAVKKLDDDNRADIIAGDGPPPTGSIANKVRAYLGKNIAANGPPPEFFTLDAFDGGYIGGVFVG